MIVTTRFPDLPPRPETAANAAFRRRFFARWGRENSVFAASTRQADYPPMTTALSFKTVLDGRVSAQLGRRRLVMEPGHFLLVNAGQQFGSSIASERPVRVFSLHVSDTLARELARDGSAGWGAALDGDALDAGSPQVHEQLRPFDATLLPAVRRLHGLVVDCGDPATVEGEFITLVGALLRLDAHGRRDAQGALHAARASTRIELARRVGWATDFICSHYAEPIALQDIAAAAHLSKFHLLRAFRQVQRCTPHQFLQRRRVAAAQRLLVDPGLTLEAVADAAGFGSRWTLQRALRAELGVGGRALRSQLAAQGDEP